MDSLVGWNDELTALAVNKPEAGEQITITPGVDQGIDISAIAALDAQFYQTGSNLWIVFEDGAIIVVEGYFEGGTEDVDGTPRSVIVDGETFTGEEFLTAFAIDDLPDEFAEGDVGAPETQQNGASFDDPSLGPLGDDPNGIGLLGNTFLPTTTNENGEETAAFEDTEPTIGAIETGALDEDALLGEESISITGALNVDFGANAEDLPDSGILQDAPSGPGNRSITFDTADATAAVPLESGGVPLTFALSEGDTVLTAFANGTRVFEVRLFDDGTGSYQFTLFEPLDHPDATSEDDLELTFSFTATDSNGDTASGTFSVSVNDDVPVVDSDANARIVLDDDDVEGLDGNPGFGSDTTDGADSDNAPRNTEGTLDLSFGADGGNVRWDAENSQVNGRAPDVSFSIDNGDLVISQLQDGTLVEIARFTLDASTGEYVATQSNNLLHFDNGEDNENDQGFTLAYRVTDGDGDTADGFIKLTIDDDSPVVDSVQSTRVDEDGLSDGTDFRPGSQDRNIDLGIRWGADGAVGQRSLVFADSEGGAVADGSQVDSLASLGITATHQGEAIETFTSDGVPVLFTVSDNAEGGQTLLAYKEGTTGAEGHIFSINLNTETTQYEFQLLGNLDHPADGDVPFSSLTPIVFTVPFIAEDGDGDTVSSSFEIDLQDDQPEGTEPNNVRFDEDRLPDEGNDYETDQALAKTVQTESLNIVWGADNDIVDASDSSDTFGRTLTFIAEGGQPLSAGASYSQEQIDIRVAYSGGAPETSALSSGRAELVFKIEDLPNGGQLLIAYKDGGTPEADAVFKVTLDPTAENGTYTVEMIDSLDHGVPGAGSDRNNIQIDFGYQGFDADGDAIKGNLDGKLDFKITIDDDSPVVDVGAIENGVVEEEQREVAGAGIDDTRGDGDADRFFNRNRTTDEADGSLGISWGADDGDARTLVFDEAQVEADLSGLTSRGDLINLTFSDDGTQLTATADGRTVFTVTLSDDDDGSYAFTLIDTLDHPANAQGEDSLDLTFAFVATDSDGDEASASFDVDVIDDRPVTLGTIFPRYVEEEALTNGNRDGVELGASATGLLNIYWGGDDTDTIDGARSGFLVQDDPTIAGRRSVVFSDDGNGRVTAEAAANFISVTNGNGEDVDLASLSSKGESLTFRLANNGTILIAEADGQRVFTVELSDDANPGAPLIGAGSYTFNLVDTIDHPIVGDDPSDEDALNFTFNFTARDGDGDIATGNFEVRVVDDSPVIDDTVDPIALTVDEDDIRTVGIDIPGQNSGSTGTSPNDNDDDGSFTGDPRFVDRGPANVSGSLASQVSFGADDGQVSFTIIEEAAARSALDALNLQSNGQSLSFDIDPTSDGSVVYGYIEQSGSSNSFTFGNGGDRLVFRLTLNEDGSFEFELFDQLDHVEGKDDNTDLRGGADGINFGSIIEATDGDGDTVPLTDRFSIEIRDDVPEPDIFVVDTVRVDETYGLHSDNVFNPSTGTYNPNVVALFSDVASDGLGPDGNSGTIYARDNVVDGFLNVGADEFASDVSVELLIREGIDSGLDTTGGDSIFLFKEGDLVVGRIGSQGGDAAFALHIDGFGRVSIAQYKSLKHPDDQTSDEHIDLDGKVFAQLTVTDNDGDTASDIVNIGANVTFDDDGPAAFADTDIVLEGNSAAGIENVTTGNVITGVDADTDPNSIGSLTADEVGADDPGTVVSVRYNGTDYAVSDGSPATINTAAGTLVMESDGSYAYTAKSNVLHVLDVFNVRDEFESRSYDNNDGSKDWASDWSEDDGGSPFGGAIRINNDGGDGALRFTDGGRDGIERTVDLTGAQSATLSFDFREDVNRNNEDVRVFISSNGGPFRELIEIDNSDSSSYQNVSFDISGDISSNTIIRITVDDDFEGNDDIYIDNVNIEYTAVDGGVEVFEYTLKDADGDTDTAKLAIEIKDGGPSVGTPPALQTVDEDDLSDGNNDVVAGDDVVVDSDTLVTGDLAIAWGADDADTATGTRQDAPSGIGDRSVTFDATITAPNGLTSDGEQITYEVINGGTALIARADGRDVFVVGLNDDDSGSYTFRLLDNLDHSAIDTEDNIDLEFGFVVTDSDGDTATGSFTVSVDDDSPDARWARSHIEVDEATQIDTVVPGQLQFKPGADGAAVTSASVHTKLGFVQRFDQENLAGQQIADLEVGGFKVTAATETVAGVTTITGTVENGNDTPAFEIVVQPDGIYEYTQFIAFDHPDEGESGADDKIALRIDFTVTDGDGDTDTAGAYVRVADDTPIVDWTDSERTNNFRIISDDETVKDSNDDPIGNLGFGDNTSDGAESDSKEFHQSGKSLPISFGADGGTVVWNTTSSKGLSGIEGGPDSITFDVIDNADTSVLLIKQAQGGSGVVTVAEVTLDKTNGDYSYKQVANLLHAVDPTKPNVEDDATFELGFTVEDGDGDIVEDSLQLLIDDDTPTIRPFDTNPDRTIIAEGTVDAGTSNDNGQEWNRIKTIDFSVGADGAAEGGAVAWDPLTSGPADGSAVGFNFETNDDGTLLIYQNQGIAGDVLVAEVTMNSDTGRYEVIEKANVLHTGTDGDSASLTLKFTVTDGDGDTVTGERLLVLRDDTPIVDWTASERTNNFRIISDDDTIKDSNGDPIGNAGGVQDSGEYHQSGKSLPIFFGADGGSVVWNAATSKVVDANKGTPSGVSFEVVDSTDTSVLLIKQDQGDPNNLVTVAEVTLDKTNGDYSYKQVNNLLHQNLGDNVEDDATFELGFTVEDGDGDIVEDFIPLIIDDDTPVVGDTVAPSWFEQDFESASDAASAGLFDASNNWVGDVAVVPDGTGGINTPDGGQFAILTQGGTLGNETGPFTRFDGYKSDFQGGFTASVAIYLDTSWSAGEGFDYSVAATRQDGDHQRDFIFHVTKDTSTGKLLVGGSNNTNRAPREDLDTLSNNLEVTTSGWYTFEHVFRDAGDGTLAVDLNVYDSTGTLLFTETRNNTTQDLLSTEIGGNRYGWFTNIDVDGGIAVDDLTLSSNAGIAIVDEDDLSDGNNDVALGDEVVPDSDTLVSGDLAISWGADNADNATGLRQDAPTGVGDRSVTFDDALDGATPSGLTSDGEQVSYSLNAEGTVLTASAGGRIVFIASVNDDDTGSYTFRLLDNLDHSTVDTEDNINLEFGFAATDSDGDTATGSFTVSVDDDTPVIDSPVPVTVSEAGTVSVSATAQSFTFDLDGTTYSFDIAASRGDLFVSGGNLAGPTLSTYNLLVELAGGTVRASGNFSVDDPNPSIGVNLITQGSFQGQFQASIGGLNTGGNYQARFVDQADADTFAAFAQELEDRGLLNEAFRDNGFVSATGDLDVSWGADDTDEGNNNFNQDAPGGTGDRSITFTDQTDASNNIVDSNGDPLALSSGGIPLEYSLNTNGTVLTATAGVGGAVIFTVALDDDDSGSYRFRQSGPLDHSAAGADELAIGFSFTATDSDGDTDQGQFTVNVTDDVPSTSAVSLSVDASSLNEWSHIEFDTMKVQLNDGSKPNVLEAELHEGALNGSNTVGYNSNGTKNSDDDNRGDTLLNSQLTVRNGAFDADNDIQQGELATTEWDIGGTKSLEGEFLNPLLADLVDFQAFRYRSDATGTPETFDFSNGDNFAVATGGTANVAVAENQRTNVVTDGNSGGFQVGFGIDRGGSYTGPKDFGGDGGNNKAIDGNEFLLIDLKKDGLVGTGLSFAVDRIGNDSEASVVVDFFTKSGNSYTKVGSRIVDFDQIGMPTGPSSDLANVGFAFDAVAMSSADGGSFSPGQIEFNLRPASVAVELDLVAENAVDFGADGPADDGGFALSNDTSALADLGLKSGGVQINYDVNGGVLTATAGVTVVFSVALTAEGKATFTQFETIDDQAGGSTDVINLPIAFTATDGDGDSVQGTFTVAVEPKTIVVDADGNGDFLTIQAAIDDPNTLNGDIIVVKGGAGNTHAESGIDVTKSVTIKADKAGTILDTGIETGFTIDQKAVDGIGNTVRIEGFDIKGSTATTTTYGIRYGAARDGNAKGLIEIIDTDVSGFSQAGIYISGGGAGLQVLVDGDDGTGSKSTVSDNGYGFVGSSDGKADLQFFEFLGNLTLKDLDVVGTNAVSPGVWSKDGVGVGINIQGYLDVDGPPKGDLVDEPIGIVVFDDVSVTGNYAKPLVYILGYNDFTGLSFINTVIGDSGTQASTGLFIDPYLGAGAFGGFIDDPDNISVLDLSGIAFAGGTYSFGSGQNLIIGVPTDETINGTEFDDVILGSFGDDTINSFGGDDVIIGGLGADAKSGGDGEDTFVLNDLSSADTILDYTENEDKIDLTELLNGVTITDVDPNNIADYVKIENGVLKVDRDGLGGSETFKDAANLFSDGSNAVTTGNVTIIDNSDTAAVEISIAAA